MRLTLVISSLGSGGAERVMAIMANYWAAKEWQITLLTFDDGSTPPFYKLDIRVRHIPLAVAGDSANMASALRNARNRTCTLRRAIKDSQPDAVISFIDRMNVTTLVTTRGLNVPVIVSERIDPAMHHIGGIWRYLRNRTYPWADLLIVQSKAASDYFSSKLKVCTQIIPNPVPLPPENILSKPTANPSILSVGRLDYQKGFDLLLEAFASLKGNYENWTITIFGEGPLRRELETLRDNLGLANRVFFLGRVENIYEQLKQASLFVMSSRYEGFPNALCEAMSCGLPVISTDCPSGPREIISDGIDGLLVANENIDALAEALRRLMDSEVERKRLATRAPEVVERFRLETVMGMWEAALNQVISRRRKKPVNAGDLASSKKLISSALDTLQK